MARYRFIKNAYWVASLSNTTVYLLYVRERQRPQFSCAATLTDKDEGLKSRAAELYNFYHFLLNKIQQFWAAHLENIPSDMCTQRRLISVQSDQSSLPREESLIPWLSKTRLVTILIRLCECAGWSELSLGAHVRGYVSWRCGSFLVA